MESESSPVLTRPTNSSATLVMLPTQGMVVGEAISLGMASSCKIASGTSDSMLLARIDCTRNRAYRIWFLAMRPAGAGGPRHSHDVHVHACDNRSMRTTIEMKPEHRARILELAANRGEKGFSTVVAEALELYLEAQGGRTNAIRSALALKGSMRETEAAGLMARTRKIRADWR